MNRWYPGECSQNTLYSEDSTDSENQDSSTCSFNVIGLFYSLIEAKIEQRAEYCEVKNQNDESMLMLPLCNIKNVNYKFNLVLI